MPNFGAFSFLFFMLKGAFIKMKENKFQANLICEIKKRWPNSIIIKEPSDYIQGIPDLLVLNNGHWAALECKQNSNSKRQPNQEYYISKMDSMSFARFVHPENKEEVLDEMERLFTT